jgi:TetR/AcrR family tetracycline transcriptional repressor
VAALLDAGTPEKQAAWTTWTLFYFALGLVREQQGAPADGEPRLTDALAPGGYPALSQVAAPSNPTASTNGSTTART